MNRVLSFWRRGRVASSDRLRHLAPAIKAMPDGAILTDPSGAVVAANEAAIALSKGGVLGEAGALALQAAAAEAATGARVRDRHLDAQDRRPLRLGAAPIVEGGRTIGVLVTVREADAAPSCPAGSAGDAAAASCSGGALAIGDQVPALLVDPVSGTIVGANAAAAEFVADDTAALPGHPLARIDADGALCRAVATGAPSGPAPARIHARGGIAAVTATTRVIDRDGRRLSLVHLDRRVGPDFWPSSDDGPRIAAAVNHSLRTPLTSIIGFAQMIRDAARGDLPQPYRDYAAEILSGGMRLMSMVEDAMDLMRLAAGGPRPASGATDLRALVDERLEQVRAAARPKGVRLLASGMRDAPLAGVDRPTLTRIVDHLLANAVRFAPSGGRIAVAAREHAGMVHLVVEDDGPGVQEAEIGRLGRPFQVGDEALARGDAGLGLGLSIVRGLAEAHGGFLEIARGPEGGAAITVGLPRAAP